ncbi:MAG: DUF4124 domain-containing protein [Gammaproteobacteria bacterium]|jgi:hypothetical protein
MVKVSYSTRLLPLILVLPFLLGAEVYRWVDDEGVVHYSERPERNTAPERISVTSGGGARRVTPSTSHTSFDDPEPADEPTLNPQQQALQDELNQQEQTRLQDIAKARAENCRVAKERFDNLTQYARIRIRGDDGEYRILSEEERVAEINQAKADVVEFCPG